MPGVSFAIIGVGGFLGIGKREVVIPTEQLKLQKSALTRSVHFLTVLLLALAAGNTPALQQGS